MYYRRKVLLALIEAAGGKLKRTDCQKLLFLFCQLTGRNHYDFFPYQFGAFSFVASYDKKRLTELGHLTRTDDFELVPNSSFMNALEPRDKMVLNNLAEQLKSVRGKSLIRKTYLEYPYFACRSKITRDVLRAQELKQAQYSWNTDTAPCLFTLGYEKLTIDSYLNRLITNNISAVVDVRNNPQSMKYGFAKKTLSYSIESAGMRYFHIPELGVPSEFRKDLSTPKSYEMLFEQYEAHMLPKQAIAVRHLLSILAEHKRIALTCFEANHLFCHRHKLVNHLKKDKAFKISIVHL